MARMTVDLANLNVLLNALDTYQVFIETGRTIRKGRIVRGENTGYTLADVDQIRETRELVFRAMDREFGPRIPGRR